MTQIEKITIAPHLTFDTLVAGQSARGGGSLNRVNELLLEHIAACPR